ncbi:MAG: NYN domain-containing protein [Fuerstiella sp.]|nr:NYN domain-containing protein [Fuerstiella sp.]
MPAPFILIDGYNLMHAIGFARRSYGPGDLEVCRNRLLQQLVLRLNSAAVDRTTVVFDAFGSDDDSGRHQKCQGVSVIYAPAGTDADSEMERLIADHSSPRQLMVVSSDHRLHRAARRRKANVIDSHDFWNSLDPESVSLLKRDRPAETRNETAFRFDEFVDTEVIVDEAVMPADDDVFDSDYLSDLESEFDD